MTTKIQHKLSPEWAQHVAEVLEQIKNTELQAWALEGQAAHNRKQAETMRKHLVTLQEQIARADKLPASKVPYKLSPDGSSLIGEIDLPKPEVPNGVANSTE